MNTALKSTSSFRYQKQAADYGSRVFSILIAIFFVAVFGLIIGYLIAEGADGISLPRFSITGRVWDPTNGVFGIAPFIVTTLITVSFVVLFASIISLTFSVFIFSMLKAKLRRYVNIFIELLSGIPSVLYGLFGYFILIIQFGLPFSILTASIILTFMVLPLLVLFISIQLNGIDKATVYASYALGATKTETAYHIYFKAIKKGFFNGLFVAITRALGETIAVTILLGNNPSFNTHPLSPATSMTSIIAQEFQEATGAWKSALFAVGIVLMIFVFILNIAFVLFLKLVFSSKSDYIARLINARINVKKVRTKRRAALLNKLNGMRVQKELKTTGVNKGEND